VNKTFFLYGGEKGDEDRVSKTVLFYDLQPTALIVG
jgi:hypothetical protein